jgi:hypothetical protein
MAAPAVRGGFSITKGEENTFALNYIVASGGTGTIAAGSPTKLNGYDAAGFGAGKIIPMVDGNGAIGSASSRTIFAGIAKSDSNDTTTADGTVQVWAPVPGLLYRGYAKTSTLADTQAELNALMGKRVVFDLGTSPLAWTVDTAATDALANCVCIAGGDPNTASILFVYSQKGTNWDTATAITS